MIKKLLFFLPKKKIYQFLILSFFLSLTAVFEIVSIATIPLLVMSIVDISLFNTLLLKINILEFNKVLFSQDKILFFMTIIIISIFLFKSFFLVTVNYIESLFIYNVIKDTSARLYEGYLNSDYSFHLKNNSAILSKNISHDVRGAVSFLSSLFSLIREGLLFFLICVLLLLNSPKDFLLIFSVLTFFLISFYYIFSDLIKKKGEKFHHSRSELIFIVEQSLGFIKEVIILNKKNFFFKRFFLALEKSEQQSAFLNTFNKIPRVFFELVSVILCLFIIYYFFFNSKENLIPIISLYGVALIRMVPAYSNISTSVLNLKFYLVSFNYISAELKKTEKNFKLLSTTDFVHDNYKINVNSEIFFNSLSFKYENTDKNILEDINFKIKIGQVVAIFGSSGTGKTTLGDLLMGLHSPTKGSINFDGKNIRSFPYDWKKIVGYVSQDIFLLDDSIKNNIVLESDPEKINKNLLDEAIFKSNCHEFLIKLPKKMDTQVGENGARLSGGQKQRIGIARTLYHNPKIFLFDEPTSKLDEKNEKEIINTIFKLKKKNKFVFIITHKLSNLIGADQVLFLKEGGYRIFDDSLDAIKHIKSHQEIITPNHSS